ncbi:MAG: DUF2262 domain-containing protein, partial [Kofleriaceae bacterium]
MLVEGFVRQDPRQARRGVVVFLSPWWHGPAHFPRAPLRVRIPGNEALTGEGLARGAPVVVTCTSLEAPRRGAGWWAATGSARLHSSLGAPPPESEGRPLTMLDHFFGRMVLELRSNVFTGQRQLPGRAYKVLIDRSAERDDHSRDHLVIERARAVVRMLELELARIHLEVASRARAIYVDKWRRARALLTVERTAARITMSSARIRHDGRAELCFADGDLFYGHWIQVELDSDLCVQSA